MVSRRNYISISVVMFIIFFMFQFSNVALDQWNEYDENPYAENTGGSAGAGNFFQRQNNEDAENAVVFIGNAKENIGEVVQAWTVYTRRNIRMYRSLELFENDRQENADFQPEMVLIDSGSIDWEQESAIDYLEQYAGDGMNLIFCSLPDVSIIEESPKIQNLLGIAKVEQKETTVTGIHLYEGFLLGEETIYQTDDEQERKKRQDLELTFPWYRLASGTKVYMNGMLDNEWQDREDNPVLIWRRNFENAFIFAVNGTYMEDMTGLGILTAMMPEMKEYEIYPVVNAQNMVVANYPGMASENSREMERRYGQSMQEVFRNVLWPGIISVYQQNQLGLSCMMTPQFHYDDKEEPDAEELIYYSKLMSEQKAELGLSGMRVSDTPILQKLTMDKEFMDEALPDYRFSSFYAGDLSEKETDTALKSNMLDDVKTVVTKYDGKGDILGYISKNVTKQSVLADGLNHTYRDDLLVKSVETALGYTSVLVDMTEAAYPKDKGERTWKDMSEDFAWNIQNFWRDYHGFSGTTVSECDKRIRSFFELEYTQNRDDDNISLTVEGIDTSEAPAWFILQLNHETVRDMTGGSWQRLSEDAYLIEAEENNVTIAVQPADGYHYMFE